MTLDLAEMRERAEAAIADHVFVEVSKDELLALIDEIERLRNALHIETRVGETWREQARSNSK